MGYRGPRKTVASGAELLRKYSFASAKQSSQVQEMPALLFFRGSAQIKKLKTVEMGDRHRGGQYN